MVTGGAGGLGLVMAQALTTSGADVALVDLNGILCSIYIKNRISNENCSKAGHSLRGRSGGNFQEGEPK